MCCMLCLGGAELEYRKVEVYENIEIEKGIYRLSIEGNFKGKPGQFYMLRSWNKEPYLSRPISINDICGGKIYFAYQVVGRGTEIFSNLRKGDEIKLMGPLGNGFPVENAEGKAALVSGGMGTAPMLYVLKSLKNCSVDVYSGFKNKPYIIDSMNKYAKNVYVSTEDGSTGQKGFVTDIFDPSKYDMVFSCGPKVMMKSVVKMCIEKNVPVYVSMEERMACGIGACLGCTLKTKHGNKRTCKDGPVFYGSEVIFDD